MSRIGRMPIEIPAGVTVTYDNHHMNVKGPKGELSRDLHPDMIITVEGNTITVARPSEDKAHRALHGLTRALVANMVTGVAEGFTKTLESTVLVTERLNKAINWLLHLASLIR